MSFRKGFRTNFPRELQKRFCCYWHVMHPVTFDPNEIYRIGWTDKAWDAFQTLLETRAEVVKMGHLWSYNWNWDRQNIPDHVPSEASLSWDVKDNYPSIEVDENELPRDFQETMREWIYEAYRYRELGQTLFDQLQILVRVNYQNVPNTLGFGHGTKVIESSICNTPATLLAIWPELIPFIPSEERDVMRHRHMRPSPPRVWDEEDQEAFHAVPGMDEITHALATMALIPQDVDENYPNLTG